MEINQLFIPSDFPSRLELIWDSLLNDDISSIFKFISSTEFLQPYFSEQNFDEKDISKINEYLLDNLTKKVHAKQYPNYKSIKEDLKKMVGFYENNLEHFPESIKATVCIAKEFFQRVTKFKYQLKILDPEELRVKNSSELLRFKNFTDNGLKTNKRVTLKCSHVYNETSTKMKYIPERVFPI